MGRGVSIGRIGALIGLAVLMAAAGPATAQDDGLLERAVTSRAKGPDSATVTVYEIADFQCPYCARFALNVAPQLHAEYVRTGRVQWIFVNLPLHTHDLAWQAAEAALCAGALGDAFWPMHDRLFVDQDRWSSAEDPTDTFIGYAETLGLPVEPFRSCLARDAMATLLLQDVTSVVGAQITGTPTFLIMRGDEVVDRLVGVKSFEEWRALLEGALEG